MVISRISLTQDAGTFKYKGKTIKCRELLNGSFRCNVGPGRINNPLDAIGKNKTQVLNEVKIAIRKQIDKEIKIKKLKKDIKNFFKLKKK